MIFIIVMAVLIQLDVIDLDTAMTIGFFLLVFGVFTDGDDKRKTEAAVTIQVQEQVADTFEAPEINVVESIETKEVEEDNGPRIEQTWSWND